MPVTLLVLGKCRGRPTVAGVATGSLQRDPLLFAFDHNSGRRFLVYTGAEISVFPATGTDKRSGSFGPTLVAANHTSIRTYWNRTMSLNFKCRHFKWYFTLADVPQPLLGADFLQVSNLLVDLRNRRLVDAETFTSISCRRMRSHAPHLAAVFTVDNPYAKILAEFPEILTPKFSQTTTKQCRTLHPYYWSTHTFSCPSSST